MKILVDFRESHTTSSDDVLRVMERKEVKFEKTALKVGDFVVENENGSIVCERKLISDFVGSVFDGRLQSELRNLETCEVPAFVIIVGNWEMYYKNRAKLKRMKMVKNVAAFSVAHRLGVFASIACRYHNVKLLQVESDSQFVDLIQKLCEKSMDGKLLGDLSVIRRKRADNIYVNILNAFPGMGVDRVTAVVAKYSTFKLLQKAVRNETFEVKGIGKKTLESLRMVLF